MPQTSGFSQPKPGEQLTPYEAKIYDAAMTVVLKMAESGVSPMPALIANCTRELIAASGTIVAEILKARE